MKTEQHKSLETVLAWTLLLGIGYWITRVPEFLIAAGLACVTGLLFPAVAVRFHRGWTKIAKIIGGITSRVLLAIIFFLVLTPLALVSRLFGKRSLNLNPDIPSYYKIVDKTLDRDSLENSW